MVSDRTVLSWCLACGAYVSVTLGGDLARCPRCTCHDLEPVPRLDERTAPPAPPEEAQAPKRDRMVLGGCVACGAYVTVGAALMESVSCPRCACTELELIADEGERPEQADVDGVNAEEDHSVVRLRKTGAA